MKIIFSSNAGVGNGESIVDRVRTELRATGATFDCRHQDRNQTIFDHLRWDDIGTGSDPFWNLGILADNRGEGRVVLWARSNVKVPEDRRERVNDVLRRANSWKYGDGSFNFVDRANSTIRYLIRPDGLEDLDYGLKGAFEGTDDILCKVAQGGLWKAMGYSQPPAAERHVRQQDQYQTGQQSDCRLTDKNAICIVRT